ncbi:MAG TPA: ScyD/ScyE family protein [Actinomycetota bacterium]|nr:ScyD/ScyE family protein [Actinomycetota bacterium]
MARTRWGRALVGVLVAVATMGATGLARADGGGSDGPRVTVIAEGLSSPRGLAFGRRHALYVAEAGKGGSGPCAEHPILGTACVGLTGAVTRIWNGDQERVVRGLPSIAGESEALGPHDVAPVGRRDLYVAVGLAGTPELRAEFGPKGRRLGYLVHASTDNRKQAVADLVAYEAEANPDRGPVDSNPFGILADDDTVYVTDAGANDLLAVDERGDVSTVAVFRNRLVDFQGEQIPMNAVPTTVVRGPDGALYVGELTGFPFPIGGARVYRVEPGERPKIYAGGFTNIIDIAFAPDGTLYVLEIAHNSLLAESPEGALIAVTPDGERSVVIDGLFFPGGVEIGGAGKLYVTNCGVCFDEGEVLRISP